MDFILLAFIHYQYDMQIPFVCGDQALFGIVMFSSLLKSAGGFKLNQAQIQGNKLFKLVFDLYIQSLLNKNQLLEIFLEKKRSRSGKISKPTEELFG